jgi:hypothetical protein
MAIGSPAAGISSFIDQARQTAQTLQGQGNLADLERIRKGYLERYQKGDPAALDELKATFAPPATSTPQINSQGGDIAGMFQRGTQASTDLKLGAAQKTAGINRTFIENKLYGIGGQADIQSRFFRDVTDTAVGAQERQQGNAYNRSLGLLDITSRENQRGRDLAFGLGSRALDNELQIANKYADTAAALSKPTTLDYLGLVPQLLGSIALAFA